jgi:hypothetical protein
MVFPIKGDQGLTRGSMATIGREFAGQFWHGGNTPEAKPVQNGSDFEWSPRLPGKLNMSTRRDF